ncbi:MAG TPA: adenylate/guanylate cyclase domain-containing protein [Roseiarcus sp.]|jgi:adenylate cyclase
MEQTRPRRPLFQKYFVILFGAVIVPLIVSGASDAWFGFRDQSALVSNMLGVEARAAAEEIKSFLDGIVDQLGWTVQLPWSEGSEERHKYDLLRLMRQAPAIVDLIQVDGAGIEKMHLSRVAPDVVDSRIDRSNEDSVLGAVGSRVWYGPVTLHEGSEPYMTIAVAGSRVSAGVTIATVNLKLILEVMAGIRVGRSGDAFVVDRPGHLVAHPDISLVLRGVDDGTRATLQAMRIAALGAGGEAIATTDIQHRSVLVAVAPIAGPDWTVFAEDPIEEALAPIRAALWRTGFFLLSGGLFAAGLAYLLAYRLVVPIRKLEEGAKRIGAGQFDHKIAIATGDELEQLADRFNVMAGELALSQERSERIARLKRFLAPQVAELVERSGEESLLDGQRVEVVVVFCDLRGFTAFASSAGAEETMNVLRQYYAALGAIITQFEATLTNLAGDGLMMLMNAPVARADCAFAAVRMAAEMQQQVQALIVGWRRQGHTIGFGMGLAKGVATVGRIGYEGRLDYTAIGSVVNLASRLCGEARDAQILIDPAAAHEVATGVPLKSLGSRGIKGFGDEIEIHAVEWKEAATDDK